MKPSERTRRFRKAGGRYLHVAAELGVAVSSVQRAVEGKTVAPRLTIANAVAAVIGAPVEAVFPALFAPSKVQAATARAATAVAELGSAA